MKAKTAFIFAGFLALLGLLGAVLSFTGSASFDKTSSGWAAKVKKLQTSSSDPEFPSPKYVLSESDQKKLLASENLKVAERLKAFSDALGTTLPGARSGRGDPAAFNIAYNRRVEAMQQAYKDMTEEFDWTSAKACPVVRLSVVPKSEVIDELQAKLWIFDSVLASLNRHTVPREQGKAHEQRTLINSCTIEKNPDAGRRDNKGFDYFQLKLTGLLPFSTVAAALDELQMNEILPPAASVEEDAVPSLLFVLDTFIAERAVPDPKGPTIDERYDDEPAPDRQIGAPLHTNVTLILEVRRPKPYQPTPP